MTALMISSPRAASAFCFSSRRMNAEICGGVYSRPKTFRRMMLFARLRNFERQQRKIVADVREAFAHESFDREDGVLRVFDHLFLAALPTRTFPCSSK